MKNQSYYKNLAATDDICNLSLPLCINCTGYCSMYKTFVRNTKRHDFYLQIMDTGVLKLGQKEQNFKSGEFIIHKPEIFYRYRHEEEKDIGYYWIHFTGSFAETLIKNSGIECGKIYNAGQIPSSVKRNFELLFREFITRRVGFEDSCNAILSQIIVALGRAVRFEKGYDDNIDRFADLLEYLHCHYNERITISKLAESENLSESRFRSLFVSRFGYSPREYIIGLRISRAKELLINTNLTIGQIAQMVGYDDPLYFTRVFSKKVGIAPNIYRQKKLQS